MKLEVGMYARTKYGYIARIDKIYEDWIFFDNVITEEWGEKSYSLNNNQFGEIVKASHNIIDLIEVGDIIKFKELRTHLTNESGTKFYDNYVVSIFNEEELEVAKEEIEGKHMKLLSIVTKEQFESMQYKVV